MNCNIRLKICIDWNLEDGEEACVHYHDDDSNFIYVGEVTENSNVAVFKEGQYSAWSNPMQFIGNGSYHGFRLSLMATEYRHNESLIDAFNFTITNSSLSANDFTYISHDRPGVDEPTLIGIAWKAVGDGVATIPTNAPHPTTPAPPPKAPYDCSDRTQINTSGIYNIQPDPSNPNNIIPVYCDVGTSSAYTVVQSRGSSGHTNPFTTMRKISDYTNATGEPGVDYNYWFGLDNFYKITTRTSAFNNYSLQIDLCCGTTLVSSLHYDNFKVLGPETNYTLIATAELNQTGIDSPGPSGATTDIGSKFSTYDEYNGNYSRVICTVLRYFGRSDNISNAIGGWWIGSCTNNLNGYYYALDDTIFYPNNTCQINPVNNPSYNGAGIEMRTLGLPQSLDGHSYTRVRMALYRVDQGVPTGTTDFCSAPASGGTTGTTTQETFET
uniref:Fibrinogen C-terminal domain-containing protein n=1 Tax=Acrobeloides nanus TaxID=290746 RepID=A0A914DTA0_9BILA